MVQPEHKGASLDYHYTARQYSKLAAHYDDMSSGQWHAIVDKQATYIQGVLERYDLTKDCDILNPTCGRGTQLFGLAERGHHCTGIDLAEGQLEKAKAHVPDFEKGTSIRWIAGDALFASQLVGTNNFDVVLSFGNSIALLGDFSLIKDFLKECYTVLRRGGIVILTGMDYTAFRLDCPHVIQHGQIKGEVEGGWLETAIWNPDGERYISYLHFIYSKPQYRFKSYDFGYLYALTKKQLEKAFYEAGFVNVSIAPRTDIPMLNFYISIGCKL